MKPNDAERAAIGRLVASARVTKFRTKQAAYEAARLNAGTWDKVETGATVRDDRLAAVVDFFWPETGGDWTRLDLDVGGTGQGDSYVSRVPRDGDERVQDEATDSAVLDAIRAMQRDLQALHDKVDERFGKVDGDVAGLSERVARLEEPRS